MLDPTPAFGIISHRKPRAPSQPIFPYNQSPSDYTLTKALTCHAYLRICALQIPGSNRENALRILEVA